MINTWSAHQWIAFTGLTVAGLSAVALLSIAVHTVRGWTAPAHPDGVYLVERTTLRPTVALAERRTLTAAQLMPTAAWWLLSEPDRTAAMALPVVDPTGEVLEHFAPGPGSVASLRATTEFVDLDPLERDCRASARAWLAEAFDRPAHVPTRDEARELDEGGALTRFHAAIENAMRTARLWEIQGRGNAGVESARQALDHWRMDYPTGGWPTVPPVGGRLPAFAEAC